MPQTDAPDFSRHFVWGWGALLVFAAGGLALEALHAFKLGFYLDVGQETRRLMWTLAHAHGGFMGGLNLAFALTAPRFSWKNGGQRPSRSLRAATLLLPGGFLLGGLNTHGGDPGIGVLLAPVGGLCLVFGLVETFQASKRAT